MKYITSVKMSLVASLIAISLGTVVYGAQYTTNSESASQFNTDNASGATETTCLQTMTIPEMRQYLRAESAEGNYNYTAYMQKPRCSMQDNN